MRPMPMRPTRPSPWTEPGQAVVRRVGAPAARAVRIARYVWTTSRRLKLIQRGSDAARHARDLARDTADAGVLFIKMAQFVSARSDLVRSPEVLDALESLQDAVPPDDEPPPAVPGVRVEPRPMASASVAQVYAGVRLEDGQRVAVKRVRRGVRERIGEDLPILVGVLQLAKLADVAGAANMLEVVHECAPMLLGELDLRAEARAQAAVKDALARRHPRLVLVPAVYHATESVMVSQFVESRKITDALPNPWLARRLFELYVRMVLQAGTVHADPHAGNIGVRPDGVLVLYDFGATVDVSGAKAGVARLMTSLVARDVDASLRALVDMGIIRDDPSTAAKVRRLAPRLRRLNPASFNEDLAKMPEFTANDDRLFQLTTQYVYLIRSLVIVQGLVTYHDPDFDLTEYLRPYEDLIEDSAEVPPWEVARDLAGDVMSMPASLRSMEASMTDLTASLTTGMARMTRAVAALAAAAAVLAALRAG
jgi:hypothetical protein